MTASTIAIVKRPSPRLAEACELTFIARTEISHATLQAQHRSYCEALTAAGAELVILDADDTLADSVFAEDTAVVLNEIAIMTRPGSETRRAEPEGIAPVLARERSLAHIRAPATLEGGDVLRMGRTVFVGRSTRTNNDGIAQLAAVVTPLGYMVVPVDIDGSLHLKTACTALDHETVLLNPEWLDVTAFSHCRQIQVSADEPFAANVLPIGKTLIVNAAYPRTLSRVHAHAQIHDIEVCAVDIAEFGKAEAGLTCMSLVFDRHR